MSETTSRDRLVGNMILAVLFAIGLAWTAVRSWRAIALVGFQTESIIWLLALLGFGSLTWRTAQAAYRASKGSARSM